MHLLDAPGQLYTPPALLMEGLRRVRACADLLWDPGKRVWVLGEVRPNHRRMASAIRVIRGYWAYVKKMGVGAINAHLLWEQQLVLQGWSWIRDYRPVELGWNIVEDYARMCWKEDFGVLEAEWQTQLAESDDAPMLRKIQKAKDYARYQGQEAFKFAMLGRRSVGPSPASRAH